MGLSQTRIEIIG